MRRSDKLGYKSPLFPKILATFQGVLTGLVSMAPIEEGRSVPMSIRPQICSQSLKFSLLDKEPLGYKVASVTSAFKARPDIVAVLVSVLLLYDERRIINSESE